MSSLGPKGMDKARRINPLFQRTAHSPADSEPVADREKPEKTTHTVRKGFYISEELDDRLQYYCLKNRIKSEVVVLRDALDKYLPQPPEGWRS